MMETPGVKNSGNKLSIRIFERGVLQGFRHRTVIKSSETSAWLIRHPLVEANRQIIHYVHVLYLLLSQRQLIQRNF